jgi:hypothetical protein
LHLVIANAQKQVSGYSTAWQTGKTLLSQSFVIEIRNKSFADDRLSAHAAALSATAHALFIYVIKLVVATILADVGA